MVGAMVSASTGVMNSLLGKLSTLLEKEYAKHKNLKKDVEFLRKELSSMNAVLDKYAMMEEPDVQVKAWMKEVRELSYDIEDCIDAFMVSAEIRPGENVGVKGFIRKNIDKLKKLSSHHSIANEIQELKEFVVHASERRARYKLDETTSTPSVVIDPRLTAFFVEATGLVGIEEPTNTIIGLLMKEDEEQSGLMQQLKVVSIVGFGGLGKTTLANQVYKKIKGQFDCSAIVSMSQRPNMKKVLMDMLSGVGLWGNPSDGEKKLIDKLREHLEVKRYFIVVDDIWSTQAWEYVKSAFPENHFCSRIITTTRIIDVAKSCSSFHEHIYNIKPLSDEDSRRLFFKRIFRSGHSCPIHLEEVSAAILKKCGGLPLAVLNIASLLASKSDTRDEWEQVKNSIGSALEKSHTLEGMKKILLLSYHDLPHYLKTCLLYLSIYPEDYEIEREELVWRWISEGLIDEVRGKRLDQVGEGYFNDLINRSMIQPVDIQYDGRVRCCRIHDMVLNIIISLSNEENFVTVIDEQEGVTLSNKIRRLSIQSTTAKHAAVQSVLENQSHVRSIVVFGVIKQVSHILKSQALRVLDLSDCNWLNNHQIEPIGCLFQLRYLRLSCTDIDELPDQIGNLQYLEVLDVRNSLIEKLPETIVRLRKLVRLFVEPGVILPAEIGNMQGLQELSCISIPCNSVKFVQELGGLTKLRELKIAVYRAEMDSNEQMYREILVCSLCELGRHNLQGLRIYCAEDRNSFVDTLMGSCCPLPYLQQLRIPSVLPRVPIWIGMLANLVHLELMVTRIEKSDLGVLKDISALLFLKLHLTSGPDQRVFIGRQGFQCLKTLHLTCSCCGCLAFAPGAMPKLQWFCLNFLVGETMLKYGDFNFGVEHLKSLRHIIVEIVRDGATNEEMVAAEAAIRNASTVHPDHPVLEIGRI